MTRAEKDIKLIESVEWCGGPIGMMKRYLKSPMIGLSRFADEVGMSLGELRRLREIVKEEDPELAKLLDLKDGNYSPRGYDSEGYDSEGFNRYGKNRDGKSRAEVAKYLEVKEKIEQFGTPAEVMQEYLDAPLIGLKEFLIKKKMPSSDFEEFRGMVEAEEPELVAKLMEKTNQVRERDIAILRSEIELHKNGELSTVEFFKRHESLDLTELVELLGKDRAGRFVKRMLDEISDEDLGGINKAGIMIRIFGDNWDDAMTCEKGLKVAAGLGRLDHNKFSKVRKYIMTLKDVNIARMKGRISYDDGKNWHEIGDAEIADACRIADERHLPICLRVIKVIIKEMMLKNAS